MLLSIEDYLLPAAFAFLFLSFFFCFFFFYCFCTKISLESRRLFNFLHAHVVQRERRTDIYGNWDLRQRHSALCNPRDALNVVGSKTGLSRNEHCDCDRG